MDRRFRSSTYRATSTTSGTGCRQGATFLRRCGGSKFQRRMAGRDRWAFQRLRTASHRRVARRGRACRRFGCQRRVDGDRIPLRRAPRNRKSRSKSRESGECRMRRGLGRVSDSARATLLPKLRNEAIHSKTYRFERMSGAVATDKHPTVHRLSCRHWYLFPNHIDFRDNVRYLTLVRKRAVHNHRANERLHCLGEPL